MKSPDDPCRITTSWSESTVALTLERSLTVFQKSRLSFSASVTPVTFNSRREFSETPRRIRPPSELANALYVSHRLSGNLSLAFFASIQLASRSSLTSDSERLAKEINSITSEFATLYAFPPVYRHFIRLSASFSFWGSRAMFKQRHPPPLATLKTQKPETGIIASAIFSRFQAKSLILWRNDGLLLQQRRDLLLVGGQGGVDHVVHVVVLVRA